MKINRLFTTSSKRRDEGTEFEKRTSRITNPDGSVVFEAKDIDIPVGWSQVATDIIAQKYFRRAGIPRVSKPVPEDNVPAWLWRSEPDHEAMAELPESERFGGEQDSRQVFHRLAGCWTYWGYKHGYFDEEEDARAFYDELFNMLANQRVAPNSPQWFNTGLHWAYGITGPAQGHHYCDPITGELKLSENAYEHPQPHACFIQGVQDDLVNDGGIMDLWVREARLFKYGSGTGTNFSHLRGEGEALSGGGKSSGLMGFLKIGDRAAGAIKSGGTTRRAAKMVIVDADHPDIEQFIKWKVLEEQKVASIVAGSKMHEKMLNGIFEAIRTWDGAEADAYEPNTNPALKKAIREAAIKRIYKYGFEAMKLRDLAADVGITAGSLYNYITQKEDFLFQLLTELMDAVRADVTVEMDGITDPAERLRRYIAFHLNWHTARRMEVSIGTMELRSLSPEHYDIIVGYREEYQGVLTQILQDGQDAGLWNVADVKVATYAIIAMLTGISNWYRVDGPYTHDELIDQHVSLVMQGLNATPAALPGED